MKKFSPKTKLQNQQAFFPPPLKKKLTKTTTNENLIVNFQYLFIILKSFRKLNPLYSILKKKQNVEQKN